MKKILFLLVCPFMSLFSCTEKPANVTSSLILEKNVVEASQGGGSYSVGYRIENPVDETTTPTVKLADDTGEAWISNFTVDATTIRFEVAATIESRTAEIEVNYPGLSKPETFTVTQSSPFAIVMTEMVSNSFSFTITPSDMEMPYLYFVTTQKELQEKGLDTDDKLFAEDMKQIDSQKNPVKTGNVDDAYRSTYNTEYVIYTYGFDADKRTRTTDIVYYRFTTPMPEMVDADFTIDATAQGRVLDITVTPNGYNGYFTSYVIPTSTVSEYLLQGNDVFSLAYYIWENTLTEYLYNPNMETGLTKQDLLDNACSVNGEASRITLELDFSTDYTILSFALNGETLEVCSEITTASAKTEEYKKAELAFDIKVTEITGKSFKLSITPSNDEDSYAFMVHNAWNHDEESIREVTDLLVTAGRIGSTHTGSVEQVYTQEAGIDPLTKHIISVFGYENAAMTTDQTLYTFYTLDSDPTTANMTIEYDSYYDMDAIIAADPDRAAYWKNDKDCWLDGEAGVVLPYTAIPSENAVSWSFEFLPEETLANYADNEGELRSLLRYRGISNIKEERRFFKYGEKIVPVGFAIDEEGNWSKVWKGEPIDVTKDGADSNVQTFLDWHDNVYMKGMPASILPASESHTSTDRVLLLTSEMLQL